MEHIKLFKTDIKIGESIYIPVDIVYYKEKKDDITKYRLTRIINEEFLEMSKYPEILKLSEIISVYDSFFQFLSYLHGYMQFFIK